MLSPKFRSGHTTQIVKLLWSFCLISWLYANYFVRYYNYYRWKRGAPRKDIFFFKIYIAASLLLMKLLAKLLISEVPKLILHELAIFAKCFIRCLTKHLIEVSECASEVFYNIELNIKALALFLQNLFFENCAFVSI